MDTPTDTGSRTDKPARWSLRLFGGFELTLLPSDERLSLSGKRERVLLAYLALSPNCRVPRRKLTRLLWGEDADETTLDNLRTCMWRLRKTLDDTDHSAITSQDDSIVLDAGAIDVDVLAFRHLSVQRDRSDLSAAANLYAGEFLDSLDIESEEFRSWRSAEATRYRDQAIGALSRLVTLHTESGESERASEAALRLLWIDPLHEEAVRQLMRLYAQTGRRAAAIQLYHSLASALRGELDTEPEADTRLVFAEISRGMDRALSTIAPDVERSSRLLNIAQDRDSPVSLALRPTILRWPLAAIATALVGVIALMSYVQFAPSIADKTPVTTVPSATVSLAVLPFSNLSGDASQEFFSDGMTEEVTAALARVPNLRVVARTSAFEFKGQSQDIRRVAESLGATHVLEGAVRKEADRVRITTQLIDADDGTQIWSESYDRQLTDIFAIQEDIARAIATSLRMPLGLNPGRKLVNNRNIDPESYEKLLRAKALYDGRLGLQSPGGMQNFPQAEAHLNEVIARYPDNPIALSLLGAIYFQRAGGHAGNANEAVAESRAQINELREQGEAAAQRALQADPNLTGAYAVLATFTWSRAKPLETDALYTKALSLDPADFYLLDGYAIRLGAAGRVKDALALLERARAVEPFQPAILERTAEDLWLNGRNDEAIALAKTLRPDDRALTLAKIYASMGRYSEAADALTEIAGNPDSAAARAASLLRTAPTSSASPDTLPRLPGGYEFVYLHVGAPERAITTYERRAEVGFFGGNPAAYVWHSSYAPVRKTERFKTLMRKAGLVEYWKAKGWPGQCRPTTADDFVCE